MKLTSVLLTFVSLCGVAYAQSPTTAILWKDGTVAARQFVDAVKVNIRPAHRKELSRYVAAIRYAENGKTYQYGIIHPRCKPGYRNQAGWCAATVQKNYDRWVKAGSKGKFVVFLGKRYCPVGAKNDPNGLNKHWIGNVKKFYARFKLKTVQHTIQCKEEIVRLVNIRGEWGTYGVCTEHLIIRLIPKKKK